MAQTSRSPLTPRHLIPARARSSPTPAQRLNAEFHCRLVRLGRPGRMGAVRSRRYDHRLARGRRIPLRGPRSRSGDRCHQRSWRRLVLPGRQRPDRRWPSPPRRSTALRARMRTFRFVPLEPIVGSASCTVDQHGSTARRATSTSKGSGGAITSSRSRQGPTRQRRRLHLFLDGRPIRAERPDRMGARPGDRSRERRVPALVQRRSRPVRLPAGRPPVDAMLHRADLHRPGRGRARAVRVGL